MAKINLKELAKGIITVLSYFIGARLLLSFFYFLEKTSILPKTTWMNNLLYFLVYVIILAILFAIYHNSIKEDYQTFKRNRKECLKTGLNYWLKGLFIMITSNIVINFILKLGTSVNEQANIQLIKQSPLTLVPIVIFLAPCIEELVFRKSFSKISENKHIFAWTTGLIFGGVHVISSLSDPRTIIFLIPYCSVGIAFGYLYKKTNTIFSSLSMHILHNTINIAIILLAIITGVNI